MSGFIGSGDVFAERTVGGVSQGLIALGNAMKLEIKENSDTKTRTSKQRDSYGGALDTVVIKKPADVSLSLDDLNKENIAIIFMGSLASGNQSASSVTDEAHTVGDLGSMVALSNGNISAVTVTGLVEGTDFEIADADAGFVRFLEGGTVVKGQEVAISYTAGAITGDRVNGGTSPDVKMRIILVGKDLVTQEAIRLEIPKAVLTPQSGVDFLSEDFTTLEMSGTANIPTGATEAYNLVVNRKLV